jgi:hypothetical protein
MRRIIMTVCFIMAGGSMTSSPAEAADWTKRTYQSAKIAARCTAAQCMTNRYRDQYEMKFLARDWSTAVVVKPGKARRVIEVGRDDIGYSGIRVQVDVRTQKVKQAGKSVTRWVGNLQLVAVDLNYDEV